MRSRHPASRNASHRVADLVRRVKVHGAKGGSTKPGPVLARAPEALAIGPEVERAVGVTVEDLAALYALDSLKGFGPQMFREIHERGIPEIDVLRNPRSFNLLGKRAALLRARLLHLSVESLLSKYRALATKQIITAHRLRAAILTYRHEAYPSNVYKSNNPVPIVYARGALDILRHRHAVACVGSRGIREPYARLHGKFARVACANDFTIISGFALGADTIGHEVAWKNSGRTICVMPCGLDRPFPPENKYLWAQLLDYSGAAFVSEFPFGMRAASLTLRKRNKLIMAFALGVLISQSSSQGGAMNAYRFALEQHKPVATFSSDGTPDTSGNFQISETHLLKKVPPASIVFPLIEDVNLYEIWLRQLSSLT